MSNPSQEVLQALPHRDPFLFIDSIETIDEQGITAKRVITGQEDFFRGHYPNNPIMPGVLLCECIFQAGAIFLGRNMNLGDKASTSTPVVTRIQNVRFRNPIKPGDELSITAKLKEVVSGVYFMSGAIIKGGKKAVTCDFACTLIEEPKSDHAETQGNSALGGNS
jgi:3-hydroxyacyl-[acyl-carrier-protein] dehydratase